MRLEHGWSEIATDSGPLPAYASRPAVVRGPLPGVVVIQEAWGVDAHIADIADRLATAGFQALAPDLFARGGTRPPLLAAPRLDAAKRFLDDIPPARMVELFDPATRGAVLGAHPDRDELERTFGALFPLPPYATFLDLVLAATRHLRASRSQGCKVGAIGFCMGGAVSALLATADPELAAAVVYYGLGPPAERVAAIACPVLGLYGQNDPRIMADLPAYIARMDAAGKRFERVVYPDAGHAFMNDTRASYRVGAARDAWARTLAFLARELA